MTISMSGLQRDFNVLWRRQWLQIVTNMAAALKMTSRGGEWSERGVQNVICLFAVTFLVSSFFIRLIDARAFIYVCQPQITIYVASCQAK